MDERWKIVSVNLLFNGKVLMFVIPVVSYGAFAFMNDWIYKATLHVLSALCPPPQRLGSASGPQSEKTTAGPAASSPLHPCHR